MEIARTSVGVGAFDDPEPSCHSEAVRPKNLVFRKDPVFQEKILRHVVPQDDTNGTGFAVCGPASRTVQKTPGGAIPAGCMIL